VRRAVLGWNLRSFGGVPAEIQPGLPDSSLHVVLSKLAAPTTASLPCCDFGSGGTLGRMERAICDGRACRTVVLPAHSHETQRLAPALSLWVTATRTDRYRRRSAPPSLLDVDDRGVRLLSIGTCSFPARRFGFGRNPLAHDARVPLALRCVSSRKTSSTRLPTLVAAPADARAWTRASRGPSIPGSSPVHPCHRLAIARHPCRRLLRITQLRNVPNATTSVALSLSPVTNEERMPASHRKSGILPANENGGAPPSYR